MRLKSWPVLAACALLLSLAGVRAEDVEQGASSLVARYGMVPKGVVLEGTAQGFEKLVSLDYDRDKDEFILNGTCRYKNPVSRKEWVDVFKSLRKTDNLGITIVDGEPKLYGRLNQNSNIGKALLATDKFFGAVIYGLHHLLEDQPLPGGYVPKHADDRTIVVIDCARFSNFQFIKSGSQYKYAGCSLDIQIIPLSTEKSSSGGHLPDKEVMKTFVMEDTDRQNIAHIMQHQLEYFKIPFISTTLNAGKAAAFARFVRDSKLDSSDVLKAVD
jgi:hypothetical protein